MLEFSGRIGYFYFPNIKIILLKYLCPTCFFITETKWIWKHLFEICKTLILPVTVKHADCFNFNWLSCQLISSQQWGNCLLMLLVFCCNIFVADYDLQNWILESQTLIWPKLQSMLSLLQYYQLWVLIN